LNFLTFTLLERSQSAKSGENGEGEGKDGMEEVGGADSEENKNSADNAMEVDAVQKDDGAERTEASSNEGMHSAFFFPV
jgi:hypothetical protein